MYSDKVNQEARAFKAWNILVDLAPKSKIITYQDIAKALGTHPRAIRFVLELIQTYCIGNGLPCLTVLVVNKQTNEPGAGFIRWSHDNLMERRSEVRNYDWSKTPNPFTYASDGTTEDDLIEQIMTEPDNSQDVFTKVKVRGAQQMIFRRALLRAYNGCCAITGVSFRETLDAAHIIPWSQCTSDLKMNPRNGILMLCCYHRLFDLRLLSIDEDYRIMFENRGELTLTGSDKSMVASLQGKLISLPENKTLWPDKELIRRRNTEHSGN